MRARNDETDGSRIPMDDPQKYLDPLVLAKVRVLELKARLIVEGYLSGMHKSPYHGFSVEFAQHREYVPGDDIKHIDWKVYGRTGRFYLKQYEEETNLVLLDSARHQRVDALRLRPGHQVRLRLHGGGGAGLPHHPSERQRRLRHLRQPGAQLPQAVEPAVAPERDRPFDEQGVWGAEDQPGTDLSRFGRAHQPPGDPAAHQRHVRRAGHHPGRAEAPAPQATRSGRS